MRKIKRSNAKLIENGFTLDRGALAQRLSDDGWSSDRIAAEVGVSRHAIYKWKNLGLIKVKKELNKGKKLSKKNKLTAQRILANGASVKTTAERTGVHRTTVGRWIKDGKIKCQKIKTH